MGKWWKKSVFSQGKSVFPQNSIYSASSDRTLWNAENSAAITLSFYSQNFEKDPKSGKTLSPREFTTSSIFSGQVYDSAEFRENLEHEKKAAFVFCFIVRRRKVRNSRFLLLEIIAQMKTCRNWSAVRFSLILLILLNANIGSPLRSQITNWLAEWNPLPADSSIIGMERPKKMTRKICLIICENRRKSHQKSDFEKFKLSDPPVRIWFNFERRFSELGTDKIVKIHEKCFLFLYWRTSVVRANSVVRTSNEGISW